MIIKQSPVIKDTIKGLVTSISIVVPPKIDQMAISLKILVKSLYKINYKKETFSMTTTYTFSHNIYHIMTRLSFNIYI